MRDSKSPIQLEIAQCQHDGCISIEPLTGAPPSSSARYSLLRFDGVCSNNTNALDIVRHSVTCVIAAKIGKHKNFSITALHTVTNIYTEADKNLTYPQRKSHRMLVRINVPYIAPGSIHHPETLFFPLPD